MHFLAAADDAIGGQFLLPAIIGAITTGVAAIIAVVPQLVRAIREDEADDFRQIIRRTYYFLKNHNALDQIDEDLRRDMEIVTKDMEDKETRRRGRRR